MDDERRRAWLARGYTIADGPIGGVDEPGACLSCGATFPPDELDGDNRCGRCSVTPWIDDAKSQVLRLLWDLEHFLEDDQRAHGWDRYETHRRVAETIQELATRIAELPAPPDDLTPREDEVPELG